ncbi:MAG TPA: hypothetical protein VF110_12505 [Burkholderiales bacterium]
MDRYGVFFAGSLDEPALVAPVPALDLSVDELELEDDDGEDGAGVAGEDGEDFIEPDAEPDAEPDGEDGEVDVLPEVLPVPAAPGARLSAPRSQAAIRLAPSARETATARDESFM